MRCSPNAHDLLSRFLVRPVWPPWSAGFCPARALPTSLNKPPPANGQEVLTAGPVHEAFAEPTAGNPVPGLVVARKPPEPIEEMPPDVKPQGENVVWVSGYWAWDDTRKDFIWVSGIWRDAPPDHAWVSGYWSQTAEGFQWTPGFWNHASAQQVSYLPQPPQELNNQPSTPQPSANDFYVPGNWQYADNRYVWHAGYWTAVQPDWIWVPAHYVWTPSGYLYLPGHWDYALARRGVLFAPVAFNGPVYAQPNYVYAPSVVIDPGVLTASFFVRPGYGHYYFGDYYGPTYVGLGFTPWFSVGFGYDPLFSYYRWYHRDDPRWAIGIRDRYVYLDAYREVLGRRATLRRAASRRSGRRRSRHRRDAERLCPSCERRPRADAFREAVRRAADGDLARRDAEQRHRPRKGSRRSDGRTGIHAGQNAGYESHFAYVRRSASRCGRPAAHASTIQGNQAGRPAETFRGTGTIPVSPAKTATSQRTLAQAATPALAQRARSKRPRRRRGQGNKGRRAARRNPKDSKDKGEDPAQPLPREARIRSADEHKP